MMKIWHIFLLVSLFFSSFNRKLIYRFFNFSYHFKCQLSARRALSLFNILLRIRRALLMYKVYGNSAVLVLNGTFMNSNNALLVLNWWSECGESISIYVRGQNRALKCIITPPPRKKKKKKIKVYHYPKKKKKKNCYVKEMHLVVHCTNIQRKGVNK